MTEVDEACATMDAAIARIAELESEVTKQKVANNRLLSRALRAEANCVTLKELCERANADVTAVRKEIAAMGFLVTKQEGSA